MSIKTLVLFSYYSPENKADIDRVPVENKLGKDFQSRFLREGVDPRPSIFCSTKCFEFPLHN